MTAAVATRAATAAPAAARSTAAAGAVRTGPVTAAEHATLREKIAKAMAAGKGRPAPQPEPAAARPSSPPPPPRPATPPPPSRPAQPPRPTRTTPGLSSDTGPSSISAPSSGPGRRFWGGDSIGQSAAGLILAVLFWGWIALPLVRGGPTEVKAVLAAKFLNKTPDGRWLP